MRHKGKDVLNELVNGVSLTRTENRGGLIGGFSSNMRVNTAMDWPKSGEAMIVIENVTVDGPEAD